MQAFVWGKSNKNEAILTNKSPKLRICDENVAYMTPFLTKCRPNDAFFMKKSPKRRRFDKKNRLARNVKSAGCLLRGVVR